MHRKKISNANGQGYIIKSNNQGQSNPSGLSCSFHITTIGLKNSERVAWVISITLIT